VLAPPFLGAARLPQHGNPATTSGNSRRSIGRRRARSQELAFKRRLTSRLTSPRPRPPAPATRRDAMPHLARHLAPHLAAGNSPSSSPPPPPPRPPGGAGRPSSGASRGASLTRARPAVRLARNPPLRPQVQAGRRAGGNARVRSYRGFPSPVSQVMPASLAYHVSSASEAAMRPAPR
jgi:hypothetical protein